MRDVGDDDDDEPTPVPLLRDPLVHAVLAYCLNDLRIDPNALPAVIERADKWLRERGPGAPDALCREVGFQHLLVLLDFCRKQGVSRSHLLAALQEKW